MSDPQDTWTLAGRTWTSRLIVGTGKFKDAAETQADQSAQSSTAAPPPPPDTFTLVATGDEFMQILVGVPTVARGLAESLARRLRATDQLLVGGRRSARAPIG